MAMNQTFSEQSTIKQQTDSGFDKLDPSQVLACPGCDLLLEDIPVQPGEKLVCPRCDEILRAPKRNSIDHSLGLSLTGLLLFPYAVFMPIMTLDTMGLKNTGTIFDGIISTWHTGYFTIAIALVLTSVVFPLTKLCLVFWISLHLKFKRIPNYLPKMMRIYIQIDEWGMTEVQMIGILVTIIKMHHMASIHYNVGFFCFIALMATTVGSSLSLSEEEFWEEIEAGRASR